MTLSTLLMILFLQVPAGDPLPSNKLRSTFSNTFSDKISNKLSNKQWQGISLLGTSAAHLVLFFDKPIDQWNKRMPSSVGYRIWKRAGTAGRYYDQLTPDGASVIAVASLVSLSLLSERQDHFETALIIVEAQLLNNLISGMAKHVAGRVRPDVTDQAREFEPFTFVKIKRLIDITRGIYPNNAMVSGHTSGIFTMAAVLSHRYESLWVQVPVYTLATSVALNRVQKSKHWASDVLLGAALGWVVGHELSRREVIWSKRVTLSLHLYHHEGVSGPGVQIQF